MEEKWKFQKLSDIWVFSTNTNLITKVSTTISSHTITWLRPMPTTRFLSFVLKWCSRMRFFVFGSHRGMKSLITFVIFIQSTWNFDENAPLYDRHPPVEARTRPGVSWSNQVGPCANRMRLKKLFLVLRSAPIPVLCILHFSVKSL